MSPRQTASPRIAVMGAFPFPYPQGSQVFVADQTRVVIRAKDGGEEMIANGGKRGMGHALL